MDYGFSDFVGNLGVFMIVGAYLLLQLNRMAGNGMAYSVINGLGAAFILYSLFFDFNLSAFIIEIFWILFSLIGIGRILLERRRTLAE